MIVPEEIIHYYIYPVTMLSVFSNLTLIYIILITHDQHMGAYRYLLLSFAVVDILISTVHFVVLPAIHMTDFGFIFYGLRFMQDSTAIGVATNLIFVGLFYQTFVLLAFHYVYRYVLLCNPSWLRWIGRKHPWRNWISLAITIDVLYIGAFILVVEEGMVPNDGTRAAFRPMLKEAYNIDLEGPNKPGYLGVVYWITDEDGSIHWSVQSLVTFSVVVLLFFGSALVIAFCIWKVREGMKTTGVKLSPHTRLMQKQLFRALLVQTLVPTVTSYVPLGTVFVIPLTGLLSLDGIGTAMMMSAALFPLIDPFLVILLVTGFRKKMSSLLCKKTTPTLVHAATSSFTDSKTT